jgi:hypothetical protein
MSITIVLTEQLRAIPYFSDLKEEQVEVPDKPFVRQVLEGTLDLEDLTPEQLCQAIETSIYFTLKTRKLCRELLWKIGAKLGVFEQWFINQSKGHVWALDNDWELGEKFPVVVKAELTRLFGKAVKRDQLLKLGIRCLGRSCEKLMAAGNLRLLKWAHEEWKKGAPKRPFWTRESCSQAAEEGNLACLNYAHEQGAPWEADTCFRAAKGGHLKCLKYLHEQGCPLGENIADITVRNGHLICLKYLIKQGRGINHHYALSTAAYKGHLEVLKYLYKQGYKDNFQISMIYAAENGHLACLKYLLKQGFPRNENVCSAAARGGHIACLRFLHEQGCPWNEKTCSQAAQGGHLECLIYAHENGCPWGAWTPYHATKGNFLDCLTYAYEQGCEWEAHIYAALEGWKPTQISACHAYIYEVMIRNRGPAN